MQWVGRMIYIFIFCFLLQRTDSELKLLNSVITGEQKHVTYPSLCSQAKVIAMELNNTNNKNNIQNTPESVKVQCQDVSFFCTMAEEDELRIQ